MSATPRPWTAEGEYIVATRDALEVQSTHSRPNGEVIAACHPSITRLLSHEQNCANAEMIVHRVNAHDSLVSEIETLKRTDGYGLAVLVCSLFDAHEAGTEEVGIAIMQRLKEKMAPLRAIVAKDLKDYEEALKAAEEKP